MKLISRLISVLVTPRSVDEDEARLERTTRTVLSVMGCVAAICTVPIVAGFITGLFSINAIVIILFTLFLTIGSLGLCQLGQWRIARYLPAIISLLVGLYGSYVLGLYTTLILFYGIAVFLAAMLVGNTFASLTIVASLALHLMAGLYTTPTAELSEAISVVIMLSAGLVGIAIMQRYTTRQLEQALGIARANEYRFRSIYESASTGIIISDMQGKILSSNVHVPRFLGYTQDELIGLYYSRLIHPDEMSTFNALFTSLVNGGRDSFIIERRLLHKNNQIVWGRLSISAIRNDGSPLRVIAICENINEQKRAERLQIALYQIADAATNVKDLDSLYRSVHRTISELIPAYNFYIVLLDPASKTMEFPYYVDEYDKSPGVVPLGRGITEYVMRSGQPLLATPEVVQQLEQSGQVVSRGSPSIDWLGVPLMNSANQVIGALVVQSYTPGTRYSPEDADMLSFVSRQVGMAVERKRSEEQLAFLSIHDLLTGAFNRNFFEAEMDRLQNGRDFPISIVILDVDGMKTVNDTLGHAIGDELLKNTAHLLHCDFRPDEIIARIGGDEFCVLLPKTTAVAADKARQRVRRSLEAFNDSNPKLAIHLSIGVATGERGASLSEVFRQADRRMYREKDRKKRAILEAQHSVIDAS